MEHGSGVNPRVIGLVCLKIGLPLRDLPRREGNTEKADTGIAMMMKKVAALFCLLLSGFVPVLAQQQKYSFNDPSLPVEKRIDSLLSLMTTEEKVACLGTQTGVPRLGVKNVGASEGIHGVVQREARFGRQPVTTTQFPQPPGMGESWDPEMVRKAAAVEGYEARFISQTAKYDREILMLWGPQSDLARDPRWGRSEEVYGEDPFFNGTMAVAFIKGLQGEDPKYWQSAALLKHFLANSNEDHRNSSTSISMSACSGNTIPFPSAWDSPRAARRL